jgi:hypothetical protein
MTGKYQMHSLNLFSALNQIVISFVPLISNHFLTVKLVGDSFKNPVAIITKLGRFVYWISNHFPMVNLGLPGLTGPTELMRTYGTNCT